MSTFKLPDLGEGLAEAEIREWHVKPGDRVVADQPMVSVETAKAVVEVPVPFNGTVTALRGAVGDIVATGAPLIDFDAGTVVGTLPTPSDEEFVEPVIQRPLDSSSEDGGHSRDSAHSQDGARSRDGGHALNRESRPRAVPVARALANRLGFALHSIAGSGPGGLVTLDDVVRHANLGAPADSRHATTGQATSLSTATPINPAKGSATMPMDCAATVRAESRLDTNGTAEPLRGARRAMAHSMSASRDQVAASTVCDDADIDGWSHRGDYMPRLMRALSYACAIEPALNTWYDGTANSRTRHAHIDLAIAVDTPSGLIVPVVRSIQDKTLDELRAAIIAQKHAAHERSTPAEDLRDFTLMLSNFGTLAGRYGIPLVVPPAVAILGAGKVRREAVVVADAVVARRRMPLSLSFDHRCVTGGEACRFLAAVIMDLEKTD